MDAQQIKYTAQDLGNECQRLRGMLPHKDACVSLSVSSHRGGESLVYVAIYPLGIVGSNGIMVSSAAFADALKEAEERIKSMPDERRADLLRKLAATQAELDALEITPAHTPCPAGWDRADAGMGE